MITKFQIIKLFLGKILNYIFSVIRNGLYLPYVTSLFLYLLFISVIIFFSFLSSQAGISFVDSVIMWLGTHGLINFETQNISVNLTEEQTKNYFIYSIILFGMIYDLIIRLISVFKKDFNEFLFQVKIIKILSIFYLISAIVSVLIVLLILKTWWLFSLLSGLLIFNIFSLALALIMTSALNIFIKLVSNNLMEIRHIKNEK